MLAEDISKSLQNRLAAIVGASHVIFDRDTCLLHSRTTESEKRVCLAVVYPGNVEEICSIMRLAAQCRVPVWPFSRGNNWGYGTKNAIQENALILVLERMNRILEVNDELAYAVVEPGVTQQQLFEYLSHRHPQLLADCTDSTPLGSVLGNAIERGFGYTPYGDHFGHLCGLEIILPTGELLRTGGAMEGCPTWNTHKWGSGPSLEGLFSQGNFGVIVKGGVWLYPKPQNLTMFTLDVEQSSQLPLAINGLRRLALEGVVQSHVHTANAFQTLSLCQKYPQEYLKAGTSIPKQELARLRTRYGIPLWTAVGGIYGRDAVVKKYQQLIKQELSGAGTVNFFNAGQIHQSQKLLDLWQTSGGKGWRGMVARLLKSLATNKDFTLVRLLPRMYELLQGKPGWTVLKMAYFKNRLDAPDSDFDPARDQCGIMWLAPAVPMTGAHVEKILGLVEPIFEQHDFNMSASLTMMNARTLFLLVGIFFDQENPEEKQRAGVLYRELSAVLAANRYQQYRGGVQAWAVDSDIEPDRALDLLGSIKKLLDPDEILAPGRYHIASREANSGP